MQGSGATPVPDARGFVTCAKHDTRRKALYCTLKPVYDADLTVIAQQYECREGQTCTSRRAAAGRPHTSLSLGVGNNAGEEGRREGSPAMEVINCSSSCMLGGEGKGWERAKYGGSSSSTVAAVGRDTGAFSVLFTKKADDSDAKGPGNNSVQVEEGISSDGMSGEDGDEKIGGDEVIKKESQKSPEVNANAGFPSEPLRQMPTSRTAASSRYFDLRPNNGGGGGGTFPSKVCWNCGLPDHEKPNCPNMLCRSCHGSRGAMNTPHFCAEVRVASPFVVLPRSAAELPQGTNGMPSVRCVRCHELGHFDCGNNISNSNTKGVHFAVGSGSLTCCYCGGKGHTGYDCYRLQRAHPDRWVQRHLAAAAREESGRNDNEHKNNASSHHGSSYPSRQSHHSDAGPSKVYRSSYNHRGYQGQGTHDGHQTRDVYYGQNGRDSRHSSRDEPATSHWNAVYHREEDRYERHSRRHRAEGGEHHHHHHQRSSRSDTEDWRRGRQEDYRHHSTRTRGGGRRGYSGFSSEEDLF